MLPTFVNERRRPINLGGASSVPSQAAILQEVKARRLERQDIKQRQEKATRLQAWWRGVRDARTARQEMRRVFHGNITGITGLRCLIFIGRDEEILGKWSSTMNSSGEATLFEPSTGPQRMSWIVLIRKTSLLLLQSVAESPQSTYAVAHLKVLNRLLSSSVVAQILGPLDRGICNEITEYLLRRNMYWYLAKSIKSIPVSSKSSPSLPLIISLVTLPFSTFSESSPDSYSCCLEETVSSILAIQLLPYRLLLSTLTALSSRLPFSSLDLLLPAIPRLRDDLPAESKIHLIANLVAFVPPRYQTLSPAALDSYLRLLAVLMNSLPSNALDPPEPGGSKDGEGSWLLNDSDSESEPDIRVAVVSSSSSSQVIPPLDTRIRKRLQTLPSIAHLNSLLAASHSVIKESLISFFLALTANWPARRDRVLSAIMVYTGGGIVREIYRGFVRNSPIGRDDSPSTLMDPANAAAWPPILFMADIYTHALLTMGDDEFFSSATNPAAPRNPLTLDEVSSLARRLLNIAFTLYWRDDQSSVQEGGVQGLNFRWEVVREKVTKCLVAIHARDSRKPFTPPGHWLVSSQFDMQSFVDAAVFEEQKISAPSESRPLSRRQISYLSPRLGLLNHIPFAIPFEIRVSIFRHFVNNDMKNRGVHRHHNYLGLRKTRVQVRRGSIAEDGFDKLGDVDLKSPIEITFIDQFGQEEAGIDGGGVFKEFLTSLCKEVFDTDRGLWLASRMNELYPNPHGYATEAHSLNWYRFIGRILGKAIYEGILVDVAFAGFFLAKWLGKQSFLDDLASLDPDLYQGLIFLKHYNGDPEDLSINFTVAVEDFGSAKTLDLIPDGSNITVTRENRLQYIHLISHYRLSKQIKLQSEAFFEGLSEMIDPKWLRMFNQQEVQVLLGGANAPIDFDDLRSHTHYGGVYDEKEPTILSFWNVVNAFDQGQRRALLRFVTSCSRPPLLGFKELHPNFAIRDASDDEHRLPTSSTCVNLLKLPRYKSEKKLREKLLQAITAGAGFDLS